MRLAKYLFLSILLVALSACGTMKVQELGSLNISPNDYRSHLATRYQAMVRFEADEMYDHIDAAHFARKALGVLSGDVEPLPEEPADWRLGKPFLEKITNAHARLRLRQRQWRRSIAGWNKPRKSGRSSTSRPVRTVFTGQ
jgi:hypothetical protein